MSVVDQAFARLMDGQCDAEETKAFLLSSIDKMRDSEWLVAGARAMRTRMISVQAPEGAIDVCGTGGDGAHTLNISTAVTFVVAGAGVPVAKHGNRAMSSKCGAADVLEALGVKLTGDVPTLERCLREAGVAFLFAQNHHPSMRHVAAARREIGQRTIFNLLGPLSNPAGVKRQLVGVFSADFIEPIAEALKQLGTERAWVVNGFGGLDELSGEGENEIAELNAGGIRRFKASAGDAFVAHAQNAGLKGGDAQYNAAALRALLKGETLGSDYAEIVQLNAAAALVAAGKVQTLSDGAKIAHASLVEGAALKALDQLIALTSNAS